MRGSRGTASTRSCPASADSPSGTAWRSSRASSSGTASAARPCCVRSWSRCSPSSGPLPPPVLIPVLLVAVGLGDTTKVAVIALGALFPVLASTADGVRSVDEVSLETARAFHLTRGARRAVVLRAATPQIFAGARQALSISLILMVVSEMVMSTDGIGYTVIQFQRTFAVTEMWAGVLVLGGLGIVLIKLFEAVERRALRWHRGFTGRIEAGR